MLSSSVAFVEAWGGDPSNSLARPLFDAIPVLVSSVRSDLEVMNDGGGGGEESGVASAEYALWLTMDVLALLLRKGGKHGGYDEGMAGGDAEKVLACIAGYPSPQTR